MAAVRETIRKAQPEADIYSPVFPFGKWRFSCQSAVTIVAHQINKIDELVAKRKQSGSDYNKITLVGYSFSAALARKIAIIAYGEQSSTNGERPAPFEREFRDRHLQNPRTWATLIKRIVLLAGINRGWSVSSAMDWWTTVKWSAMQLLGETVLRGKPTLFEIRKGAPFLVHTRLQWLALMSPYYGRPGQPERPDIVVVQLLGTGDDQVSPDDTVDYSVDLFKERSSENVRRSYFYIEVKYSNHHNVIDMAQVGTSLTKEAREERRTKFLSALKEDAAELVGKSIPRDHMADNLPPVPDPNVAHVVFIMHGIRDKGFWTQKIARRIKKLGEEKGQKFASWTESYGYFAMVPFIFRTVRQRKVEWMMDRYAEARARYPNAKFHYVGHSNGTYLAARALLKYPAARFERVVFAGSVVRRDYKWLGLIEVRNYVATRDWVVALFPKGLQLWRRFDLGSAGHDGFDQASELGSVRNVKYIVGGHSAGHEEAHWDDIAHFIVTGEPKPAKPRFFSKTQSAFWRIIGWFSVIIVPALVAVIIGFGILLFWSIFAKLPCSVLPYLRDLISLGKLTWGVCTSDPTAREAAWRAIAFFMYLWTVYLAATRF